MGLIEVAGAARPKPGERVCGDGWLSLTCDGVVLLAIVDGLGHGPEAAHATRTALAYLSDQVAKLTARPELGCLVAGVHRSLRSTRGAVAGLAFVDPAARLLHYAGVGNTEIRVFGLTSTRLFSRAGLLGSSQRMRPLVQTMPFPPGALLALHTDGLETLEPAELPHHLSCAQLAETVLARWALPRDDAAVVFARWKEGV